MTEAIELRPKAPGWECCSRSGQIDVVLCSSIWRRGRTLVMSSLDLAELPDGSGDGLQWHVSISHSGKRPSAQETARALRAFGMEGAEEDNHHPGVARHFWKPVDPQHRVDCECKTTEDTIVDPDGYRWTNPKPDEGACRGCEFQSVTGTVCPIHGRAA
jgi:hypothetical protein